MSVPGTDRYCLSDDLFDAMFTEQTGSGTEFTLKVNVMMEQLSNNTCKDSNYDQIYFCDLKNMCTDHPPTLNLLSEDVASSTNWLLWGGLGAVALIGVVVIAGFACKGASGNEVDDAGYSLQD